MLILILSQIVRLQQIQHKFHLYQTLLNSSEIRSQKSKKAIRAQLKDNQKVARDLNDEYKLQKKGHRNKKKIKNFINIYPVSVMDTLDDSHTSVKENLRAGMSGEFIVKENH